MTNRSQEETQRSQKRPLPARTGQSDRPEPDTVDLGWLVPPRDDDALHVGEVADGGSRIRVWASDHRYGITVTCPIQAMGHIGPVPNEQSIRVRGDAHLGIGRGLSCEQAEALIVELQLAIRAKRLHEGKPWDQREIAPGVLRAPNTAEDRVGE